MLRSARIAFVGLFALLFQPQANAAVVSFTGSGVFSNISNCGGFPTCSISGNGTRLNMSGIGNGGQSTLVSKSIMDSFSVLPNMNDVTIGELIWTNRATFLTDKNFSVQYHYTLQFSSPNEAVGAQSFQLSINQTTNPMGDVVWGLSNLDLGPVSLNGVTLSDLKFTEVGSGFYDPSTGKWTNPEGGKSHLLLTADFAAAVPEPSTWAMLILGFAGMGFMAYRRRVQVCPAV